MHDVQVFRRLTTLVVSLFLLAACAIRVTPVYDAALVEGLDEANRAAMTLFAKVEDGSEASEFEDYEQTYAELIGQFGALQQRAATRQIPPLATRLSSKTFIQNFCNTESDANACVNASPQSIGEILELLRQMRAKHRADGLQSDSVGLFRDGYNVAISQALTVENALKTSED